MFSLFLSGRFYFSSFFLGSRGGRIRYYFVVFDLAKLFLLPSSSRFSAILEMLLMRENLFLG